MNEQCCSGYILCPLCQVELKLRSMNDHISKDSFSFDVKSVANQLVYAQEGTKKEVEQRMLKIHEQLCQRGYSESEAHFLIRAAEILLK